MTNRNKFYWILFLTSIILGTSLFGFLRYQGLNDYESILKFYNMTNELYKPTQYSILTNNLTVFTNNITISDYFNNSLSLLDYDDICHTLYYLNNGYFRSDYNISSIKPIYYLMDLGYFSDSSHLDSVMCDLLLNYFNGNVSLNFKLLNNVYDLSSEYKLSSTSFNVLSLVRDWYQSNPSELLDGSFLIENLRLIFDSNSLTYCKQYCYMFN